jgi:hypothetical protein
MGIPFFKILASVFNLFSLDTRKVSSSYDEKFFLLKKIWMLLFRSLKARPLRLHAILDFRPTKSDQAVFTHTLY